MFSLISVCQFFFFGFPFKPYYWVVATNWLFLRYWFFLQSWLLLYTILTFQKIIKFPSITNIPYDSTACMFCLCIYCLNLLFLWFVHVTVASLWLFHYLWFQNHWLDNFLVLHIFLNISYLVINATGLSTIYRVENVQGQLVSWRKVELFIKGFCNQQSWH